MNKLNRSTNIPKNNEEKNNINGALSETFHGTGIFIKSKYKKLIDKYYQETSGRFIFGVDGGVNGLNAKINLGNIPRVYKRMQYDLQIDEKGSKIADEEQFFNLLVNKGSKVKLENLLGYFTLIVLEHIKESKEINGLDYLAFTYVKILIKVIEKIKKEGLYINDYIYNKDKFTKYLQETIGLIQNNRQKEMQDKINSLLGSDFDYKESKKPIKINKSNKVTKLAAGLAIVGGLTLAGVEGISKKFNGKQEQIEIKTQHIVKLKETAYSISKKYNTTIDKLKQNNPEIEDMGKLSIGQIINIK